MSNLIKEDDEFLYLERYLHDNPDSVPKWAYLDDSLEYKYSTSIIIADDYAAMELLMKYRIRKSDAEVIIDEIK